MFVQNKYLQIMFLTNTFGTQPRTSVRATPKNANIQHVHNASFTNVFVIVAW